MAGDTRLTRSSFELRHMRVMAPLCRPKKKSYLSSNNEFVDSEDATQRRDSGLGEIGVQKISGPAKGVFSPDLDGVT